MDDKILSPYAKGMTTLEIVAIFIKQMYNADVSAMLISKVTDNVFDRVVEWQSCPLDAAYSIFYLDYIVVKIRQDKQVIITKLFTWPSV